MFLLSSHIKKPDYTVTKTSVLPAEPNIRGKNYENPCLMVIAITYLKILQHLEGILLRIVLQNKIVSNISTKNI